MKMMIGDEDGGRARDEEKDEDKEEDGDEEKDGDAMMRMRVGEGWFQKVMHSLEDIRTRVDRRIRMMT